MDENRRRESSDAPQRRLEDHRKAAEASAETAMKYRAVASDAADMFTDTCDRFTKKYAKG